jgi:AraC family transcriptional regulator, regulatory protein of adaptative response / methylated-DNA-[protein]-cysteine methyltransferase
MHGASVLGNFIAVASDEGLVAFEFSERGTAMLNALQARFPDAAIEDDQNGLSHTQTGSFWVRYEDSRRSACSD